MAATRDERRAAGALIRAWWTRHSEVGAMCYGIAYYLDRDVAEQCTLHELQEAICAVCEGAGRALLPNAIIYPYPAYAQVTKPQEAYIRRWWLRAWEETGKAKTREDWLAKAQARKDAREARKAAKQAEAVLTPQI